MSSDCYPSVRSFLVNVNGRAKQNREREKEKRETIRWCRLFGSLADGQGKKTIGTYDVSFFFSRVRPTIISRMRDDWSSSSDRLFISSLRYEKRQLVCKKRIVFLRTTNRRTYSDENVIRKEKFRRISSAIDEELHLLNCRNSMKNDQKTSLIYYFCSLIKTNELDE